MLLMLHGNNLDETMWLGLAILVYFLFLFVYSQIKTARKKREKLRRKAERAALKQQASPPLDEPSPPTGNLPLPD